MNISFQIIAYTLFASIAINGLDASARKVPGKHRRVIEDSSSDEEDQLPAAKPPKKKHAHKIKCPHCKKTSRSQEKIDAHIRKKHAHRVAPAAPAVQADAPAAHDESADDEEGREDEEDNEAVLGDEDEEAAEGEEDEEARAKPVLNFACTHEECKFKTARQKLLDRHVKNRHKEKKLACQWDLGEGRKCEFATNYRKSLETHQRLHTREKPFICNIDDCGERFASMSHLNTHQKKGLKHNPEKERRRARAEGVYRYTCDKAECHYATDSQADFEDHSDMHAGIKRHICPIGECNKKFSARASLWQHKKTHSSEQSFQCSACQATFAQPSQAYAHIETCISFLEKICADGIPATEEVYKKGIVKLNQPKPKMIVRLSCDQCTFFVKGPPAATRIRFEKHMATHSDDRPWQCGHCGNTFKIQNSAHTHCKGVHKGMPISIIDLRPGAAGAGGGGGGGASAAAPADDDAHESGEDDAGEGGGSAGDNAHDSGEDDGE